MKDLIIIGGGPAGITAAVYAARKKLDFTMITRDIGGQAAWAGEIGNYPGYQYLTGAELIAKFREQLDKFKFDLREGVEVSGVKKAEKGFEVTTNNGEVLAARTLIVATGKKPKLLGVPGETKYREKGLTYCATCEGPLFAGKVVAVIGGGNSALDAALQMVRIASKVYVINNTDKFTGDPVMIEKLQASPLAEVWPGTKVLAVLGDQFVNAIRVESGAGVKELPVAGVFVEIGLVPNADFISCVDKNEHGEIVIDYRAETSCPSIFAAGDVTNVPEKQIVIAAGDGAKATLSAFHYLSTHQA